MTNSNDNKTKQSKTAGVKPDYDVGYGKTPVETRFKPGQSGNPKGRIKCSGSSAAVFLRHLNRKVQIPIGDTKETVTMGDLININLISKAAKGSVPHIKAVRDLEEKYGLSEPITNIIVTFPEPPVWPPDDPIS